MGVCIGAGLGGAYGLYDGVRHNALGSIAVSYSVLYCLLSLAHEDHDEAKSVVSGTLTGLMFKSSSGLKKCARGGLVGFGLSTLWAFGLKHQESIQYYI